MRKPCCFLRRAHINLTTSASRVITLCRTCFVRLQFTERKLPLLLNKRRLSELELRLLLQRALVVAFSGEYNININEESNASDHRSVPSQRKKSKHIYLQLRTSGFSVFYGKTPCTVGNKRFRFKAYM